MADIEYEVSLVGSTEYTVQDEAGKWGGGAQCGGGVNGGRGEVRKRDGRGAEEKRERCGTGKGEVRRGLNGNKM